MSRAALRRVTTIATTGHSSYELIGTTSGARTRLMELHVFLTAATASLIGLGRPAAKGVAPTSPVVFQPEDSADGTMLTTAAVAWTTTEPTIPAQFLRSVQLPGAIGAGIIWTFGPNGLLIPTSGTLVLWNLSGIGAATEVTAVIEE